MPDPTPPLTSESCGQLRWVRFKSGRLYHVIDERRQPENGRYIVAATLCRASGNEVANLVDGWTPTTRSLCSKCVGRAGVTR